MGFTEGFWCLGSVSASSGPATEDPNRFVDRLVESWARLDSMCGGRDGPVRTLGTVVVGEHLDSGGNGEFLNGRGVRCSDGSSGSISGSPALIRW